MAQSENQIVVTPSTLVALLDQCTKAKRPVMVWGPPGVGKSDLVSQLGAKRDRPVIDIRLLLMEPTDLKGIPYYCPKTNTMRWAAPSELPGEDEVALHNAILFLDEITAAPQSVQAAAYQLILNRRVGTYHLPDDVVIIAAGNRETDRAVSFRMPSALANRFIHFELKHSYEDWEDWAVRNKIHPNVVGYLKVHKGNLFNFDPKSGDKAFATPRTWEFVSQLYSDSNDETTNRQLVAGAVGQGIALEFMQHCRMKGELPDPRDILTGKVKEIKNKDTVGVSAKYSLVISLCYTMRELADAFKEEGRSPEGDKEWSKVSDRFLEFMMVNMETEMNIMGAILALRTYKLQLDTETKVFDKFYQDYKSYLNL